MCRPNLIIVALLVMFPLGAWAGGEPPKKSGESPQPAAEAVSFPDAFHNEDWPGEWSSAKAYTYNTTQAFGPRASIWVWRGESFNPNIDSTHDLTREQAEAALALVHQSAGEMLMSKCAFPRHAVVFFDENDEPLASVNVCFECGDILVYPDYADEELDARKYAIPSDAVDEDGVERQLLDLVHESVMPAWATFFTDLGVTVER